MRTALGRLLTAGGYAPVSFGSAEEFLAASPRDQPACFVLDIHLGAMSGLDLQRLLKVGGLYGARDSDDGLRRAPSQRRSGAERLPGLPAQGIGRRRAARRASIALGLAGTAPVSTASFFMARRTLDWARKCFESSQVPDRRELPLRWCISSRTIRRRAPRRPDFSGSPGTSCGPTVPQRSSSRASRRTRGAAWYST